MHLKTFHAPSIQDAIRQARRELGPDAMLLNSRRVTQPDDKESVFAVTFAIAHLPVAKEAPGMKEAAISRELDSRGQARTSGDSERAGRPSRAYGEAGLAGNTNDLESRNRQSTRMGQSLDAPLPTARPGKSDSRLRYERSEAEPQEMALSSVTASPVIGLEERGKQDRKQDQGMENALATRAGGAQPGTTPPLPSYEKLFEQMTSMRREMLQLAGSVRRASAASYRQDLPSEELRWVHDILLSQEFYPEIIEEIIDQLTPRVVSQTASETETKSRKRRRTRSQENTSSAGLLASLRETLSARIELAPEPSLRRRSAHPHVVALVGPPGVGKTTTLVKLAARYGAHSRFPLQVISMDNYRVAASEQLRTYASVLGVGFDALSSAAALEKALRQYESKELILIDTPGYGWRDFSAAEDLASVLRESASATLHLTVSASMKPSDLARVADLYEVFGYDAMLFTKIDETATIGSLVSESAMRRKPLSYLCAGQRIPEDLEVASRERIVERLLPTALSSEEFAA